jgi:hypothetical protein
MTRVEKNDFMTKLWLGVAASILLTGPFGILVGIPIGLFISLLVWAG